jgi:hypothetical protein
MQRRKFLQWSLAVPAAVLWAGRARAQDAARVSLRLVLQADKPGNQIPSDFTGLSYETALLSDPAFFAPDNSELIGFVRRLGPSGVLRVGGNTSEYGVWTPTAAAPLSAAQQLGPDSGGEAPTRRPVTPLALRNLRGFLDTTGWRLVYGLNLGTEDPQTVAAEAAFVAQVIGDKLVCFQLGNEPDLFSHNGLRAADYDFSQFAAEWRRYFAAVRARVPNAPFGGPDTATNSGWLAQFAKTFAGDVRLLSQHYYAEGPPSNPAMTISRLLQTQSHPLDNLVAGMDAARRNAPGAPFRLTETNSCYGAGKPEVSNTFASALWGVDLMYRIAAAGAVGINFHGGGYGWYAPIVGTRETGFVARPLYYGMLMFAEAGSGRLVSTTLENSAAAPLFAGYGLRSDDGALKAVLINKHADKDVQVEMAADGGGRILRLLSPRLDDTQDTTFGGAPVGPSGGWSAALDEVIAARNGAVTVPVPRASAALVTLSP